MEHKKKPRLELPESDYDSDTGSGGSSDVSSDGSSLVRSSSLPTLTSFTTPYTASNLSAFATTNVMSLATPTVFPFTGTGNPAYPPIPQLHQLTQEAAPSPFSPPVTLNSNVAPFANSAVRPRSSVRNVSPNVQASSSSTTNPSDGAFATLSSPARLGDSDDGEQLRASFRAACEEINRELDIIMQPMKTKHETLKSIEDYLVSLSKRANQSFKVDLTDDSLTTNVSLKVQKNKVTIIREHTTPNQQGEADSQQQDSEGAASNAAGPSGRIAQNNGGGDEACWMPPVNPFTSSVTLRQHLEAASNHVRPRRMRPPPGFHPTPQYNDGQGTSAGVVRPPPGFHGVTSGSVPAQISSVPGYYGLLDSQTIINDLYRHSLSAARQNAIAVPQTSSANECDAVKQEELSDAKSPEHGEQSEPEDHQSPGPPPSTSSSVKQEPEEAQGAQAAPNELWQHYKNAAAISNADIEECAGYWDDFLQRDVNGMLNSDQNSDLWKQFEDFLLEYQRVQYAPGSLRTGSTIFCSENVGPSKHGPVGHCRPRACRRFRAQDNLQSQCNAEQASRQTTNPECRSGPQDVVTLSERFRSTTIAIPTNSSRPPLSGIPGNDCPQTSENPIGNCQTLGNPLTIGNSQTLANPSTSATPQNRNELLGALLLKRLKEKAASIRNAVAMTAPLTIDTNTDSMNDIPGPSGINSMNSTLSLEQVPCTYCTQNNRAAGCPNHVLRDSQGRTVCPILRNRPCPICNKAGDNGHSVHDCPVRIQWDMDDDKTGKKST